MNELDNFFSSIYGKDLFLSFPFMDFTKKENNYKISISCNKEVYLVGVPNKEKQLKEFCGKLNYLMFQNNSIILTWNFKNFLSYCLYINRVQFSLDSNSKIFDLQVLENHLDIHLDSPLNFKEAINRFKIILKDENWKTIKTCYDEIYFKLIKEIIPLLETKSIVYNKENKYCFYEIASQANGRMRAYGNFQKGINVHSLSQKDKELITPPQFDSIFIVADYKHMEPSILQWLSKDSKLMEMLNKGDLYEKIWEDLTKIECNESYRKKCKDMFLPVIFGQREKSLADSLKISEDSAIKLINAINLKYREAISWLNQQSNVNMFGRKRNIDFSKSYLINSFIVQSVSSLFCLLKLVKIYELLLKEDNAFLTMHIHDGYVITCKVGDLPFISKKVKDIMESEEVLFFKDLKLKTSIMFGKNLGNLRKVQNEEY